MALPHDFFVLTSWYPIAITWYGSTMRNPHGGFHAMFR